MHTTVDLVLTRDALVCLLLANHLAGLLQEQKGLMRKADFSFLSFLCHTILPLQETPAK